MWQIFTLVADDFLTLFLCGYIFEDIEFIALNLPSIDRAVNIISEQMMPFNIFFVAVIINYFAQD